MLAKIVNVALDAGRAVVPKEKLGKRVSKPCKN